MTGRPQGRSVLALLAAGGLLLVALVAGAPAGIAASVDDSGWWDRNQGVTVGATSPPPSGGLRVALDPAGVSAVAAVRYRLQPSESQPILTLRITSGAAAEVASVVACPTTKTDWKGAAGGPIAEAPAGDCGAAKVSGLFSGDRTQISFDLTPLSRDGVLSALFTPVATAADPVTATFSLDVAKPTERDLATSEVTTTTMFEAPSGASAFSPSGGEGGGSELPPSAGFSPVPTVEPAGFVPLEPTTMVPVEVGPLTTSFVPGNGVAVAAPAPVEAPPGRNRLLALLIVAALLAGAAWFYVKERSVTSADGPSPGGLGKFVRERTASAPPVS